MLLVCVSFSVFFVFSLLCACVCIVTLFLACVYPLMQTQHRTTQEPPRIGQHAPLSIKHQTPNTHTGPGRTPKQSFQAFDLKTFQKLNITVSPSCQRFWQKPSTTVTARPPPTPSPPPSIIMDVDDSNDDERQRRRTTTNDDDERRRRRTTTTTNDDDDEIRNPPASSIPCF